MKRFKLFGFAVQAFAGLQQMIRFKTEKIKGSLR